MTRARPVFLLTLAAASGCGAPAVADLLDHLGPDTDSGTSSSSTSSGEPPGMDWPPVMTTTVDVDPTTTAADPSGGSSTTGAPAEPLIVGHILAPNPLKFAGPIAVSIATEHADGVRMQVDDADPVELDSLAADTYAGEIVMLSSLSNGIHSVQFTAWRDGLASEPLELAFAVTLPEMGDEAFWDSAALIGKGTIAALAGTPDGEVVEFGTFYPANQPRCYLRRRDLGGAWSEADFFAVLPDVTARTTARTCRSVTASSCSSSPRTR